MPPRPGAGTNSGGLVRKFIHFSCRISVSPRYLLDGLVLFSSLMTIFFLRPTSVSLCGLMFAVLERSVETTIVQESNIFLQLHFSHIN